MVVLFECERASALLLYLSPFLVSLLFSSSLREANRRSGQAFPTRERIIASPYAGRGLQLKLSRVPKGGKGSRCTVPTNRLVECPTLEPRSLFSIFSPFYPRFGKSKENLRDDAELFRNPSNPLFRQPERETFVLP